MVILTLKAKRVWALAVENGRRKPTATRADLVSTPTRRCSPSHKRNRERKVSGTLSSFAFTVTLGSAAAKRSGWTFRTSTSPATVSWCSTLEAWLQARGTEDGPLFVNFNCAGLQENRMASGSAAVLERLEKLAAATPRAPEGPLLSGGVQEFRSSRDPKAVYRVTFGRAGHLECTCEGFRWRGNCKHVREVRQATE